MSHFVWSSHIPTAGCLLNKLALLIETVIVRITRKWVWSVVVGVVTSAHRQANSLDLLIPQSGLYSAPYPLYPGSPNHW